MHHWMTSDLPCVGQTAIFFPDNDDERLIGLAQEICADCDFRFACIDASLSEEFGIWGGLLPWQRRPYGAQLSKQFTQMMPDLIPAIDSLACEFTQSMECLL